MNKTVRVEANRVVIEEELLTDGKTLEQLEKEIVKEIRLLQESANSIFSQIKEAKQRLCAIREAKKFERREVNAL